MIRSQKVGVNDWLQKEELFLMTAHHTAEEPMGKLTYRQTNFQMAVETGCAIAIATLSDWLKNSAPVFQPMRNKTKTNRTFYA